MHEPEIRSIEKMRWNEDEKKNGTHEHTNSFGHETMNNEQAYTNNIIRKYHQFH